MPDDRKAIAKRSADLSAQWFLELRDDRNSRVCQCSARGKLGDELCRKLARELILENRTAYGDTPDLAVSIEFDQSLIASHHKRRTHGSELPAV